MPDALQWMLVFVRISALFVLFPLFATQNVPVTLRVALAALGAFLISPFIGVIRVADLSWPGLIQLLFSEICIGLLLGFLSKLAFNAIEIAGSIISNEMGLSMAATLNPMTSTSVAAPGVILHWLGMMLFLSSDMHAWFLAALQKSYVILPAGTAVLRASLFEDVLMRSSRIFGIALQMTAPVLAVSFLVTLVFSLMGRIIPQMNVFSESFPVRIVAGMLVFAGTCTILAQYILKMIGQIPADFGRVLQLMAG